VSSFPAEIRAPLSKPWVESADLAPQPFPVDHAGPFFCQGLNCNSLPRMGWLSGVWIEPNVAQNLRTSLRGTVSAVEAFKAVKMMDGCAFRDITCSVEDIMRVS